MLALEIEWLTGVCVATRSPAEGAAEWPPQPDRVFSALTASWAARGARPEERAALEWLEGLDPPDVAAAEASPRTVVTAYVPPNDARLTDYRILPDFRRRQPRQFPASIILADPGTAHLRLVWKAAPDDRHLAALKAMAHDTSYVGHSSSLVRCRFVAHEDAPTGLQPAEARAAPYPGRLAELERLHARHMAGDATARPRPALIARQAPADSREPVASVFGRRWAVFGHAGGERPDLRAVAVICRAMRDAVMSCFPDPIPEWLSGHSEDKSPSLHPHLAVVPLAHAGFAWSDGRLMGLALILPRDREDRWNAAATPADFDEQQQFDRALAKLGTTADGGRAELKLGRLGTWVLERRDGDQTATLQPGRYCAVSRSWTTVTPIALDRHPKEEGAGRMEEAAAVIAESCLKIGLPRPARVEARKHAAVAGVPSAWPPGGAPAWQGWARPRSLAHRPLYHATIVFDEPVAGPVILGAGRFFGLGLCLPAAGAGP